jgi:dihydrofolate reductase
MTTGVMYVVVIFTRLEEEVIMAMRKVTFGGGNSLDNFIARDDDSVDWLYWNKEVEAITRDFWRSIDTVVMGRRTYEISSQFGQGAYAGVKNYVFSRTLPKRSSEQLEIVNEDAADFVYRLKRAKGKGICVMGGGLLANALFEADLIDEVGLNIHPVLLGSGIPLFHKLKSQIKLELTDCQQLTNGCVVLRYAVVH